MKRITKTPSSTTELHIPPACPLLPQTMLKCNHKSSDFLFQKNPRPFSSALFGGAGGKGPQKGEVSC